MTRPTPNLDHNVGALPQSMPLTSIEHFHLLSDTRDQPNVLFCRVSLARRFQQGALKEAFGQVGRRHCFWNRRLGGSNRRPTWVTDPSCETSVVTWIATGSDAASCDDFFLPVARELKEKLDLRSTPGAHLWCRTPSAQTSRSLKSDRQSARLPQSTLIFACHHSVCDGMGGARFISDLLIAYDNLIAERPWDEGLKRLQPERLSQRNRLGLFRWSYWKHIWKQPIALVGMAKFLCRRFHVINPSKLEDGTDSRVVKDDRAFGLVGRWISEDVSAQIDCSAADKSISVNTIAMAAVFYALAIWSRQQDDAPLKKWCRMVLPISIASKDDLRLPMTNRATIVQVDRCADQMADVDSFLRYLDREVKIIVGWQFHKLFLLVVRVMSLSHWWLHRAAKNPQARGTIVFTNLAQPMRAVEKRATLLSRGLNATEVNCGTRVIDFDFAGPTRSAMPLNFTIQRHQKRYRITARFDGRVLTAGQAIGFLEQVETELRALTAMDISTDKK